MEHLSRKPVSMKVSFILFIILITLLLCSCEKDSVTDPDRLGGFGDINIDPIFLHNTLGDPSVASTPNTNTVVVFHEFHHSVWSENSGLYYLVGTLNADNPSMSWGSNTEWTGCVVPDGDAPCNPFVTISNNGVVMCAYQTCSSTGWDGHIYVGFGTISGSSINWSGCVGPISGYNPSIAITRDGKYAVLVWNDGPTGDNIYYSVTPVNTGSGSLQWSPYSLFARGYRPSIAINDKDQIIGIFNSWQNNGGLWYTSGQFWRENSTLETFGTYSFGSTYRNGDSQPIVALGDQNGGGTVIAIAPPSGTDGDESDVLYLGTMASNSNVEWQYNTDMGVWLKSSSICLAPLNTGIFVYQDGNDDYNLYYAFIE